MMDLKVIIAADSPETIRKQSGQAAAFIKKNGQDPSQAQTVIISSNDADYARYIPTDRGLLIRTGKGDHQAALRVLEKVINKEMVLFPGTDSGEELAVRLAVRLGGTSMLRVSAVTEMDNYVIVSKPVYGGHLEGKFRLSDPPYLISIDKNYDETEPTGGVIERTIQCCTGSEAMDRIIYRVAHESGLRDADTVIAGGRGLGSMKRAEEMIAAADRIGAEYGGTRPAVMQGWIPQEKLIGVSGEYIHPNVCIVCGASGSPAFCAGIEKSKCIIAINDDPAAPIMDKADLCICADWIDILSEL